jgi:thiamine biosynthesis lipoprotein
MLETAGTALDLSAIAKGHAVDRVTQGLARLGLTDLFVEVGGEVRVSGRSPRSGRWRVGVERPEADADPGTLIAAIEISNEAVATSGNYRRRRHIEGRLVHHTLDPRTGLVV